MESVSNVGSSYLMSGGKCTKEQAGHQNQKFPPHSFIRDSLGDNSEVRDQKTAL